MFDISEISAAFVRPTIGGIGGVQRASAGRQMAGARKASVLPVTAAPSQAAKTDAAYWVDIAEKGLTTIEAHMNGYNDELNGLDDLIAKELAEFGPERAALLRSGREGSLRVQEAEIILKVAMLERDFQITGNVVEKNASGNYQFGEFTLSRSGAGYAIMIDSEDGTRVAFNRGRFNDRFSRANMQEFDRLPFRNKGALRTDLIA